ncbi:hypothetical protein HDK64DRAFT_67362 [Phyllosticta capitalensis]
MAKNNFKIPPLENKDAAAAYHEVKSEVLRKLRQRGWIMYPENQMSNKLTWNEDTYRSGANRAHKAVLATFELHRKHFDFKTKAEAQLYVGKRMVETGFAIPPLKDYDAAAAFHEVKLEVLRKLRGSGWIKYPDNDNDPGIQRRQQQSSSETACEDLWRARITSEIGSLSRANEQLKTEATRLTLLRENALLRAEITRLRESLAVHASNALYVSSSTLKLDNDLLSDPFYDSGDLLANYPTLESSCVESQSAKLEQVSMSHLQWFDFVHKSAGVAGYITWDPSRSLNAPARCTRATANWTNEP